MPEQRAIQYLVLAEVMAEALITPTRQSILETFEQEREHLEQALSTFLDRGDTDRAVRMVQALRDCWWESGRIGEGRYWTERVLVLAQVQSDRDARATILDLAGALAYGAGDYETARRHFEEALAIRREVGSPAHTAQSLNHLAGVVRWGMGDTATARRLMQESLAHAREGDARFLIGAALLGLGTIATDLGDYQEARSSLSEAVALLRADEHVLPVALDDFAALAAAQHQPRRALCLAGAAANQHERLGTFQAANIRAWLDRHLALAREMMTEDAANAQWTKGRAMTLEEAIVCALDDSNPTE